MSSGAFARRKARKGGSNVLGGRRGSMNSMRAEEDSTPRRAPAQRNRVSAPVKAWLQPDLPSPPVDEAAGGGGEEEKVEEEKVKEDLINLVEETMHQEQQSGEEQRQELVKEDFAHAALPEDEFLPSPSPSPPQSPPQSPPTTIQSKSINLNITLNQSIKSIVKLFRRAILHSAWSSWNPTPTVNERIQRIHKFASSTTTFQGRNSLITSPQPQSGSHSNTNPRPQSYVYNNRGDTEQPDQYFNYSSKKLNTTRSFSNTGQTNQM